MAASWFPRESRPPGSSESCSSHPAPGLLIRIWISQNRIVPCFTFMFERGVYVALPVDNRQCTDLVGTIARGAIPEIPAGRLVRLDSIDSLEISESDELTLAFCYMADSRRLRGSTAFPTIAARDEFIALIEAYHSARFDSELRSVGFLRATMAPLIVLLMLGASSRRLPARPSIGRRILHRRRLERPNKIGWSDCLFGWDHQSFYWLVASPLRSRWVGC